eukprot:jgi/Psemu1/187689/e_gw1.70.38.1
MNLVKSLARKALLAFGYPKLETSHPDLALYDVGAVRVRMAPKLPACQIFYPVKKNSKKDTNDFIPYYRREAVEGLLNYLNRFGDGILQILEEKAHPLQDTYAMDPLTISSGNKSMKFPLVLFSHGLSGNMEMYTQLCAQLASTGCSPLPNSKVPYSRKKVLDFRTPMLEQRVEEMRGIYEYFRDEKHPAKVAAATNESDDESVVRKILSVTDSTQLHLVGHSFGGATQLLAAQKWVTEESTPKASLATAAGVAAVASTDSSFTMTAAATTTMAIDDSSSSSAPIPHSVTVFDAWNFALSDQVLNKGIPAPTNTRTPGTTASNGDGNAAPVVISILSEDWDQTNPEKEQTLQFLRNCPPGTTHSYCAKDSVHQSVSDTEAYLPSMAARKLMNRGPLEPRHQTINAMVKEFVKQTKGTGNGNGNGNCNGDNNSQDGDEILIKLPLQ